ncbi:restriction endonuclease subunit S [Erysipelothrix rhusiopathiae]|uniref:restriction endonuclease subunit S n=1 Tax=Erysipelothrix rhusiopathiae TaxID=1648 RepID=UPI000E03621C|nr:restriction endonuclease subunit S [Erysipelothrix rhusiopathiae]STD06306.1 Restriction enzyme BgcI subunit beta [Erysipelothrix rhusiopathiae]
MNKEIRWATFEIGEIFSFTRGNAGQANSRMKTGPVAFVSAKDSNNGVAFETTSLKNEQIFSDCITVNNNGSVGYSYYHPYEFVGSSDVTILEPKYNLNKLQKLFLTTILNELRNKYSYGYKISNYRLKKQKILLPIDKDGLPHWQFMEDYIKQERQKLVDKVTEYYKNKVTNFPIQADYREYREFWLDDIVEVKSGVRLTKANQEIGKRPFIGASDSNNGITNFVNNTNSSSDRNILGVNYNGSVVENFYHPYKAIFSDDVKRLEFKDVRLRNKYGYLFLKQSILMQKEKYTYGYKFNADRMRRQKIVLPINSTGEIDYLFMMNTMRQSEKNLMLNIIDYYEAK